MKTKKKMTKAAAKNDTKPGRAFTTPFGVYGCEEYYATHSYKDVLDLVDKQIKKNEYMLTVPSRFMDVERHVHPDSTPDNLKIFTRDTLPNDEESLNKFLKKALRETPDLFSSTNPNARKLVSYFGRLVWQYHYGRTSALRNKAERALEDLIFGKSTAKYAKKGYIPPIVSLKDLFACLHGITEHLRKKYKEKYGDDLFNDTDPTEIVGELKKSDPRLAAIAEFGQLALLLKKPKELTYAVLAEFFDHTVEGIKQKIKAENKKNY